MRKHYQSGTSRCFYAKIIQYIVTTRYNNYFFTGASKGTPGDAKCVTEILGGTKIRKFGGTNVSFCFKGK